MLPRIRPFAPVVTSLAMLGLASAVQAEPKMYTGSIILHDFANDTTSGSTPPYSTATHLALPLGAHCNPANGGKTCGKATGARPCSQRPARRCEAPRLRWAS